MPVINSILIFVAGIIVSIVLRNQSEAKTDKKELEARVRKLEDQSAQLDFKVTPLWAKIQRTISEDLHHPHRRFQEMDKLLEKLENLSINGSETLRLKELLEERINDHSVSPGERASASIMAIVMDKVLLEAKQTDSLTEVSAVITTPPSTPTDA